MGELQEVDVLIKNCKEAIEQGAMLGRLKKNKDFKKLFIKHYIEEQSIGLVKQKADKTKDQDSVDKCINAIGFFSIFLDHIEAVGDMATEELIGHESTRLEILKEQGGV